MVGRNLPWVSWVLPCVLVLCAALFWGPGVSYARDDIAAVQPSLREKAGRMELAAGMGVIASDVFVTYLPVTLRGAYHFEEWVGVELSASFMGCFSGDVGDGNARGAAQHCMRVMTPGFDRIGGGRAAGRMGLRTLDIVEYQTARVSADAVFTFVTGKFRLGGTHIAGFEMNAAVGPGVQINETFDGYGGVVYGASFEGNAGIGVSLVVSGHVGVRVDFRQYLYDKRSSDDAGTASEISLGVSFLL